VKYIFLHLCHLSILMVDDSKRYRTHSDNVRRRKSLITAFKRRATVATRIIDAKPPGNRLRGWTSCYDLCFVGNTPTNNSAMFVTVLPSQFYQPLIPCVIHPFIFYHFINTSSTITSKNLYDLYLYFLES